MKKSLLALASGAFILGAAEFVMMGILPQTAEAMHVDIPTAGHFISAYAIGVCIGTLILVFGRKIPPKQLIIMFMVIAFVGNALSAFSVNAPMLLAARFISGLPHGAFFGTATLIAKTVADKGKEAQAVSAMVTGQTVANMIGVGKRIIAVVDEDLGDRITVMLNPVITASDGAFDTQEGCLSLTGERRTLRYRRIEVDYEDRRFRARHATFAGWTAQIIQHEVDHCNGIVI